MRPTLAIANMTIRELRRRRLSLVPVIALVLGLLLILATGISATDDQDLLLRSVYVVGAVGTYSFVITLVSISIASGLIADEIDQGTVLLLALRPIRRRNIVIGKLLGLLAAITVAMVTWGILAGLMMSGVLHHGLVGLTIASSLASILPILLLCCFATALGTIFGSRNALIFTIIGWVLALGGQYVYDQFSKHPDDPITQNFVWVGWIAHGIALLLPRARLQHLAGQVVGHGAVKESQHVGFTAAVLAIAAVVFWAWLAAFLFERRRTLT